LKNWNNTRILIMKTSTGEEQFWDHYAAWKEDSKTYDVSKRLLLVDWKSQKERGMDAYYDKLTPSMLNALKCILQKRSKNLKTSTLLALKKRHLIEDKETLTDYGRLLAIRQFPLDKQCRFLNLPFEDWKLNWGGKPEEFVKKTLIEHGAKAYFVENSIGLFIDYLMGDLTLAVAKRINKKVYTLNPPYDLEIFFWMKRDLEMYLESFDINHCRNSFSICFPFLQMLIMEEKPLQIVDIFDDMYRALGLEKVKSLIRMFFSNPLAYNYRGWPDLFVIEGTSAYCIEVKTTDRLHINQLITIPDLVQYTNIPVRVVRLKGEHGGRI